MRRCGGVPLPCCSPAPRLPYSPALLLPCPSAPLLPGSQHRTRLIPNLAILKVKLKVAKHHAKVGAGEEFGDGSAFVFGGGEGAEGVEDHLPGIFAGFGVKVPAIVLPFKGKSQGRFVLNAEE